MIGKIPRRMARRWVFSGVVWAMMPLAIVSGMPIKVCGCSACRCGSDAASDLAAAGMTRAEQTAAGSSGCCASHEQAPTIHSQCGCAGAVGDEKSAAERGSTQKSVSQPACRCPTIVTERQAPQPVVVAASADQFTPVLDTKPTGLADKLSASFDRPADVDTGPPTDLVVVLRHLLI